MRRKLINYNSFSVQMSHIIERSQHSIQEASVNKKIIRQAVCPGTQTNESFLLNALQHTFGETVLEHSTLWFHHIYFVQGANASASIWSKYFPWSSSEEFEAHQTNTRPGCWSLLHNWSMVTTLAAWTCSSKHQFAAGMPCLFYMQANLLTSPCHKQHECRIL
jgi:hypothetical protein